MDFKFPDSFAQAYKLNDTILDGYNFIIFVIDGPKKKPDNNRERPTSVVIGMVVPVTEGGRIDGLSGDGCGEGYGRHGGHRQRFGGWLLAGKT